MRTILMAAEVDRLFKMEKSINIDRALLCTLIFTVALPARRSLGT
jgi:hypothetical protein